MAVTTERYSVTAIRPFTVETPQAELETCAPHPATRWPERETVLDDTQGVQLALAQEIARHWVTEYDWRRCEARLNSYPNFLTEIDGLDIHFIHVRSKHEDALPMVVCHGWPGSVIEQLKLIERLTDPTAHGASASDAFHVVIPSMPGHGFSGKPDATGWGPERIGRAYVELMRRLGYDRFVAQGGDWGAIVVDLMAVPAPPGLLGIHTNMPGVVPLEIFLATFAGNPVPMTSRRPSSARSTSCAASSRPRGVRADDGHASADAVRAGGLAHRARGVHARPRRRQRPARPGAAGARGPPAGQRPHVRRLPGQRHALLAHQHRRLLGPPLLGEQGAPSSPPRA